MLPALLRAPCLVSFSGGADSAFVLAVAVGLARRLGLDEPVPCTWRFRDAPAATESRAQESVITALKITDWVRLEADDDLDLVGPVAHRTLERLGVRYPANLHLHQPLVDLAAGGSLLTGAGGDQILSGWLRPRNRTRLRRGKNRVPVALRAHCAQRGGGPLPWLRRGVARRVWQARLAEVAAEPQRSDHRVRWHAGRRSLTLVLAALQELASTSAVRLVNPLVDPAFVAGLAAYGGNRPAPTRPELLAEIAGDRLPAEVLVARPKARFSEVFFRAPTRDFVRSWDGTGVDAELVDVAALRRLWSQWPVPGGTAGLVQQAFLARHQPARA